MPKRSKTFVENELNEIFKLMVVGASDSDIRRMRSLPERTYVDYRNRLEDRLQQACLNQKHEQILVHKELARERILRDKRVFQQVMSEDRTPPRTKVEAARADLEANVVLFKLENETAMFVSAIRQQQTDVLRLDAVSAKLSPVSEDTTTTTEATTINAEESLVS